MLPESTDLETHKHPEYPKLPPSSRVLELSSAGTEVPSPTSLGESTGQDERGSMQPSGSSQATTHDPTQSENDSPHSDKQAVQSSRHGSRSRSRGETLQSEPQTPLPIDPAQVDLSQLRNPAFSHPDRTGKSDANLRTTPDEDHSLREDVGGPHVDDAQDNVGVNPHNDSKGGTGGTHQPGSQGGDHKAPCTLFLFASTSIVHTCVDLVPVSSDTNKAENYHSGGSGSPSSTFLHPIGVLELAVSRTDAHLLANSFTSNLENTQSNGTSFL